MQDFNSYVNSQKGKEQETIKGMDKNLYNLALSLANKFDGKLSLYPGWEGRGSVDAEVCLFPDTMAELLRDDEFMSAVSEPVDLKIRLDACLKH